MSSGLALADCKVGMYVKPSTLGRPGYGVRYGKINAVGVGTEHFPNPDKIEVIWLIPRQDPCPDNFIPVHAAREKITRASPGYFTTMDDLEVLAFAAQEDE